MKFGMLCAEFFFRPPGIGYVQFAGVIVVLNPIRSLRANSAKTFETSTSEFGKRMSWANEAPIQQSSALRSKGRCTHGLVSSGMPGWTKWLGIIRCIPKSLWRKDPGWMWWCNLSNGLFSTYITERWNNLVHVICSFSSIGNTSWSIEWRMINTFIGNRSWDPYYYCVQAHVSPIMVESVPKKDVNTSSRSNCIRINDWFSVYSRRRSADHYWKALEGSCRKECIGALLLFFAWMWE